MTARCFFHLPPPPSVCRWIQTKLRPLVTNEAQLLYTCHLIGPLLHRLTNEKPKALLEVKEELCS